MVFIKLQNVVINTSCVATLKLDNQTGLKRKYVSVLIATSKFQLFHSDTFDQKLYHSECVEFTELAANALQGYFTNFHNVIDLLSQYRESFVV